jgi:CheY-like chemotaxis protein
MIFFTNAGDSRTSYFPSVPHCKSHMNRLDFRSALVIDESILVRGELVAYLKERGWIAHGLKRVDQALPLLKCIPYHLLVVDSNLSGMNPINFVRRLQNSEEWSRIPLVFITDSTSKTAPAGHNIAGIQSVRRSAWRSDLTNILAQLEGRGHWKRQLYAN